MRNQLHISFMIMSRTSKHCGCVIERTNHFPLHERATSEILGAGWKIRLLITWQKKEKNKERKYRLHGKVKQNAADRKLFAYRAALQCVFVVFCWVGDQRNEISRMFCHVTRPYWHAIGRFFPTRHLSLPILSIAYQSTRWVHPVMTTFLCLYASLPSDNNELFQSFIPRQTTNISRNILSSEPLQERVKAVVCYLLDCSFKHGLHSADPQSSHKLRIILIIVVICLSNEDCGCPRSSRRCGANNGHPQSTPANASLPWRAWTQTKNPEGQGALAGCQSPD